MIGPLYNTPVPVALFLGGGRLEWDGKPVNDMTREELIRALETIWRESGYPSRGSVPR